MSMRTPLAQVRGTGSAKAGAHHWWAQRISAVALIPLFLWFVVSMITVGSADYEAAAAWISAPWNSALLILLIGVTFYHAQLGMQVVFEDYISMHWLQLTGIIVVRFLAMLLAVVSIIAVLRVAWGS